MHTIDLPNGHLKIDPDGEKKKKKKKKKNLRRRLCVCFWNAFGLESRVRTVGRSMGFLSLSLSLSHAYIRNLSLSLSLDRSVAFGNVQPAAARV